MGTPVVPRRDSSHARITDPPPRVIAHAVVGNGRPQVVASWRPKQVPAPVELPAPVAVELPAEVPLVLPTLPPAVTRIEPIRPPMPVRSFAEPFADALEPRWPAGALFGIAGLLLAPLGGVWLGYRQARASKAASQLVGS